MEAKSFRKRSPKGIKIMSKKLLIFGRFWVPIGVLKGTIKGQIRALKSDLCSSRVPGALQASILDGCLLILGPMFGLFSGGCWTSLTDHTDVFKAFAATFGEVFWRD